MGEGEGGPVHYELEDVSSQNVKVALNIRPLIAQEQIEGCSECITVILGEPQVQLGPERVFTYDSVYGSLGKPLSYLFKDCVAPLVEGLFGGYNGTVLAYGQTGSGKTYTMGSGYTVGGSNSGVIPQAMKMLFELVESKKGKAEFQIRVSYIEIHKEDVRDLLDLVSNIQPSSKAPSAPAVPSCKAPISIRETSDGGITLAGVTEMDVRSIAEMAACLEQGSLCRATGSTSMNSHSSRSHAIFTITLEQRQKLGAGDLASSSSPVVDEDHLCAKLHLVDLAGSERAKRTKADGQRLQEGIHINKGLLALGNVISALGDEKKRKEGGHVPYRDSKLTRLLQDSLGGNSRTVMIACVSPADVNLDETLNTLKYANRARNIKNKPVVNRDASSAEVARLRQQLQLIQAELFCSQAAGGGDSQALRQHISQLETDNAKLRCDVRMAQLATKAAEAKVSDAQTERDRVRLQLEALQNGGSVEDAEKTMSVVEGHLATIRHLEAQLQDVRLRQGSRPSSAVPGRTFSVPASFDTDSPTGLATPPTGLAGENDSPMPGETLEECAAREEAEALAEAKGWEHRLAQERMDQELQDLNRKLEEKEAQMTRAASSDQRMLTLKAHYERVLKEMEEERQTLQGERDRLMASLDSMAGKSDIENTKLKETYRGKIKLLEEQLSELKRKQAASGQLLRLKQRSDESAKRLQEEIQRIKSQKVALQRKMKVESDQFQNWRAAHEKELGQLRKAGRRNEFEMHKLQALHQRQQKVLQRKTEEAAVATKRLKEVLAARKLLPKDPQPQQTGGALAGKSSEAVERQLKAWLEREIEVYVRVQDVRNALQREVVRRKEIAHQLAALRDGEPPVTSSGVFSPRKNAAKLASLQAEVAARSASIAELQAQLLSVEESQKGLSNPAHRWLHVRSMPEARTLLNIMFAATTDSRCQLQSLHGDLEYMHEQVAQYEVDLRSAQEDLRRRRVQETATKLAIKECFQKSPGTGLAKGLEQLERGFQTLNPARPKRRLSSLSPIGRMPLAAAPAPDAALPNPEEGLEGVKATASGYLARRMGPRGDSDGGDCDMETDTDGGEDSGAEDYDDPNDEEYVPGLSPALPAYRRRRGASNGGRRSNLSAGSSAELQLGTADSLDAPGGKKKRPQSGKRRAPSEPGGLGGDSLEGAEGPSDGASEGCQCTGMCKRKCACRAAGGECGPHCGCSVARCANRHGAEEGDVDPAANVAAITMDLAEAMETVELEAALLLGGNQTSPETLEPSRTLSPETPPVTRDEPAATSDGGKSRASAKVEEARALLARHGAKLTQAWLEGAKGGAAKRQPLGAIDKNQMTQAARLGAAKQKRRLYQQTLPNPLTAPNSESPPTEAPPVTGRQSPSESQNGLGAQNQTAVDARSNRPRSANAHVTVSSSSGHRTATAPPDGPQSGDGPLGESSPNVAHWGSGSQAPSGAVPGDRRKRSGSFTGLQQVADILGPQSETPSGRRISGSLTHTVSPAPQVSDQSEARDPPKQSKERVKSPGKGGKAGKHRRAPSRGDGEMRVGGHVDKENYRL